METSLATFVAAASGLFSHSASRPTVPMAVIADQAAQLGCAVLGPVQVENLTLFDGVTVASSIASGAGSVPDAASLTSACPGCSLFRQ